MSLHELKKAIETLSEGNRVNDVTILDLGISRPDGRLSIERPAGAGRRYVKVRYVDSTTAIERGADGECYPFKYGGYWQPDPKLNFDATQMGSFDYVVDFIKKWIFDLEPIEAVPFTRNS